MFGNNADYYITSGKSISLQEGNNFETKQGINGTLDTYHVITRLRNAGDENNFVNTLQGLAHGMMDSGGYYVLGENIDASVTSTWNIRDGFLPIGNQFGTYDDPFLGLGHTVSNLTINRPSTTYVGLFEQTG